ncbi:ABC-type multidrug transport system fused ATPase/permease subunit [Paenibacillus xylanexedens]|uniref:ABC-type multidrug transport system fused ATPase/permease subunit n=2 Tax=Paenibacillus xylanexedens TaxID=528191 RepID=A0ABS4RSF6_PAEXY|nr:ABC-type multidrug transport system fused ATPase/permease subunit [Paenibacillus xylanexedens]
MKAIASTNLTITSLIELENSILLKTSKLTMLDIENPQIKTKREKARRFSLFGLMDQWFSFIINFFIVGTLALIVCLYGFYYLVIAIFIVLIIQLTISSYVSKKVEYIRQSQSSSQRVINYLVELLTNRNTTQEVRIYGMQSYLYNEIKGIFIKNYEVIQKKVIFSESINFTQNSINTLLNGGTLIALVLVLGSNGSSVGLFVILFQITNQLFVTIPSLKKGFTDYTASRLRFQDYLSYIKLDEQTTLMQDIKGKTGLIGVEINNINFSYGDKSKKVLKNIDININPGERIAFVGDNGSGKSTLVKLILGLYNPTDGNVDWIKDGHRLNGNQKNIRVVFQDFAQLLRPIRENVALGDITAINDDSRLITAIEKAKTDINGTDLDKMLGPQFGGVDLSGGQWQKLAIARAYLNESSLTIFDEPTAAMDPYSEQNAFNTFILLGDKQTSIIVTHRLYMAKQVDKIFLFEDGEIIESGTHEELVKKNGKYKKMYDFQSSLYI